MSKGEKVPKEVKNFLRSVLISSNGVKESRVEKDYRDVTCEKLMWKSYGFKSLNEFLNALPDVCVIQYSAKDRENRVYAVQLEGTYVSSHAKKNVKPANKAVSPPKETEAPPENENVFSRVVQQDGDSVKVTFSNLEPLPNNNGLYQVYVVKLPEKCTEKDLKKCFEVYGKVIEHQIVRSSIGLKIGFVRYALKDEALRALTEGKKNPPEIFGVKLEVGKTKIKKSENSIEASINAALNSEPSDSGSVSSISTPSSPVKGITSPTVVPKSPIKNKVTMQEPAPEKASNSQTNGMVPSSTHPVVKTPSIVNGPQLIIPPQCLPKCLPHNTRTPLSVQVPNSPESSRTVSATSNSGPWVLSPNSPTKTLLLIHASQPRPPHNTSPSKTVPVPPKIVEKDEKKPLLYGAIISGYSNKISEANLKLAVQGVGNLDFLNFQQHFSIAWFKSEEAVVKAVHDLNGKYIDGSILLVKSFSGNHSNVEELKPAIVAKEEILPDLMNEFSEIYDFYSEAISCCDGQKYLSWLNNLPSVFEVKIMDMIDPCTYWVHLSDGTSSYQDFNNLTHRLSSLNPSSSTSRLKTKELGAGRYSDDGNWYRCYCRETSKDGRNLHVMYIDYGNTEWLEREKTIRLNNSYFELRPQGVLVKLAGVRFKSKNNGRDDSTALTSAKRLMMFQHFQARKASVDSSKPFLLVIDLLNPRGETVLEKLMSLPGVETEEREGSPVPPVALCAPPSAPAVLKPLKARLSDEKAPPHLIWITEIKSTKFFFQLVRQESAEAIRQIQEMLLKCNLQNKVNLKDPKMSGLICYHKNGLERSRVKFESTSSIPGKGTVLHVDTGNLALVPLTSFIALPTEAKNIPYQARPATLYGVPKDTFHQSPESLEFIIQQATQVLRAIVVQENPDESVVVELFNSEGTNINMKLLEMAKTHQEESNMKATREMNVQNLTQPMFSSNPTRNHPVSNASLLTSSQSGPLSGIYGQSSTVQTPVQVPPDPRMQAFPNQDSTRSQVSSYQAYTQNSARLDQVPARTQTVSNSPVSAQMQVQPNEMFSQNQANLNQTVAQKNSTPFQSFSNNPNPNFAPVRSNYGQDPILPQNQISFNQPLRPSQRPPHNRASPNDAFSQNQGLFQNQASPNQTLPQNQRPFQNRVSPNQALSQNQGPSQSQVSPTQTFTRSLVPPQNQGLPQNRTLPNQTFAQIQGPPQRRASPNQTFPQNQGPPQNRASPNQAFNPSQTLAQNQAQSNQVPLQNRVSPTQQFVPKPTLGQGQSSANHNSDLNRMQHERALQNSARPNQGFTQGQPNRTLDSQKMSPQGQVSPQNRAVGPNQVPHQTQPAAFTKGTINQTIDHNRGISNQMTHQHQVWTNQASSRNQTATHNQVSLQNSSQSQGRSLQGPQIYNSTRSFNNLRSSTDTTSRSAGINNADVGTTSRDMTSQGFVSQTNNPKGFVPSSVQQSVHSTLPQSTTSQGITSQETMSRMTTSRQSGTAQTTVTSQGITSQQLKSQGTTLSQGGVPTVGPTSQQSTSTVPTLPDNTSPGPTSQKSLSLPATSEVGSLQGTGLRPTQVTKARSNSSSSSNSINSVHSDENTDKRERNEMKQNLYQTQSSKDTTNVDKQNKNSVDDKRQSQIFKNLESNKPRSPIPSRKLQNEASDSSLKRGAKLENSGNIGLTESDKKAEQFVGGETGTSLTVPTAETSGHAFPGKSGRSVGFGKNKNLHSLKSKLFEQEKVLSCNPEQQRQAIEIHKSHEKLKLIQRVKMLQNENLMLEGEIKRNREEKANLEEQLKSQ